MTLKKLFVILLAATSLVLVATVIFVYNSLPMRGAGSTHSSEERAALKLIREDLNSAFPADYRVIYEGQGSTQIFVIVDQATTQYSLEEFNQVVNIATAAVNKHVSSELNFDVIVRGIVEGVFTEVRESTGEEWNKVSNISPMLKHWAKSHHYDAERNLSEVTSILKEPSANNCLTKLHQSYNSLRTIAPEHQEEHHTIKVALGNCFGANNNINVLYNSENITTPEFATTISAFKEFLSVPEFVNDRGTMTLFPEGSIQVFYADDLPDMDQQLQRMSQFWDHGEVFQYQAGRVPPLTPNGHPMINNDPKAKIFY